MHMEMMAAASNLGWPKWNGGEMPNHFADPTPVNFIRPIGQAMKQPMMIEISTAVWPMNPENIRVMRMIIPMTAAASRMCEIWPESMFMVVTTEPVAVLYSA
jgi:hypothetical protein